MPKLNEERRRHAATWYQALADVVHRPTSLLTKTLSARAAEHVRNIAGHVGRAETPADLGARLVDECARFADELLEWCGATREVIDLRLGSPHTDHAREVNTLRPFTDAEVELLDGILSDTRDRVMECRARGQREAATSEQEAYVRLLALRRKVAAMAPLAGGQPNHHTGPVL
jgi:hypothetical protein